MLNLLENGNGSSAKSKQFVRDLIDGSEVESYFLVKAREIRQKKNGDDYLTLTLSDSSGDVRAVVWENVAELINDSEGSKILRVEGSYSVSDRFGPQVTVKAAEPVPEDQADMTLLLVQAVADISELERSLRELVATVKDSSLSQLLERLIGPNSEIWPSYSVAPAAKHYHQAYKHGLLEHSLSVAQAVSATSQYFPGINRDLAVTAALLHDIGKIEAYSHDPTALDLTDQGRLQGEIPLGYYLVRRTVEDIEDFPYDLSQQLLHIILAHHGKLENGSPVTPCTREATLVHMIDHLGGTLGSFDRIERQLPDNAKWSSWDKALEGSAYFGG